MKKILLIMLSIFIFDIHSTTVVNLTDKEISIKRSLKSQRKLTYNGLYKLSPFQYHHYEESLSNEWKLILYIKDGSSLDDYKTILIDLPINTSQNDILFIKSDYTLGIKKISEEKDKEINERKFEIDAKLKQIILKLENDIKTEKEKAEDAKNQIMNQCVQQQIEEYRKSIS